MDTNNRLKELLDQYLRDRCTETEVHLLFDYLKRAEHEPEIKQILTDYWQDIKNNEELDLANLDPDKDEWFEEIKSKSLSNEMDPGKQEFTLQGTRAGKYKMRFNSGRSYIWLKIAAILLVAITMSYLFYVYQHDSSAETNSEIQKVAAAGEKVRFVLPDGTQVHLNSESHLTYPSEFPGSVREVRLQGEGFFIVAHDKERPFLVHAKEITTKVLGTSFSIRSYPEDSQTVVAVRSGKVSVTAGSVEQNSNVILEPDEYANYTFSSRQFTKGEGIAELTAWNSGVLLYRDKELGEVAYQLERWYGVEISFENETLKRCVVRGEHRDESLTNVLEAITYAFDMEYKIDDRQVLLTGEGCN